MSIRILWNFRGCRWSMVWKSRR